MPLRARIMNSEFLMSSTPRRNASTAASAPSPSTAPILTSPQYQKFSPYSTDDPTDVLFNAHYGVRTIELNRPAKLNSLNASMARKIIPRLIEWAKSDMAHVIIISGAGGRAFCAGGDVAALAQGIASSDPTAGRAAARAYFALEYILDHLIATYSKPYIAYLDGITMGGGVGLSVHAPIRIATERTLFAMPETTIGFFPDVGGSFFLPRCLDGQLGTYLALTSDRLAGANAFYAGVATHYVNSATLPALTARLAELDFADDMPLQDKLVLVDATIAEFDTGLPFDQPHAPILTTPIRPAIDRCFKNSSIEDVLASLRREAARNDSEQVRKWAETTLHTIETTRSPTSVRVALQQMQLGRRWSINETFEREYILANNFVERVPDFVEGVSARLLRKPAVAPQWSPKTLADVSPGYASQLFESSSSSSSETGSSAGDAVARAAHNNPFEDPQTHRLQLMDITKEAPRANLPGVGEIGSPGVGDYKQYPFRSLLGLPTEQDIRSTVEGEWEWESAAAAGEIGRSSKQAEMARKAKSGKGTSPNNDPAASKPTRNQVIKKYMQARRGRYTTGIKEKVDEVLRRCCTVDKEGKLEWTTAE